MNSVSLLARLKCSIWRKEIDNLFSEKHKGSIITSRQSKEKVQHLHSVLCIFINTLLLNVDPEETKYQNIVELAII